MQDRSSPSDWLHESQFMDKIHGNGYINLCATTSVDGRQGLYRARNPSLIRPCVIEHLNDGFEKHMEVVVRHYMHLALEQQS